jgi:hypothetical protein
MSAILFFPVDVGIRRIQLEPEELKKAWEWIRRNLLFLESKKQRGRRDEAMEALLSRRKTVRANRNIKKVPEPKEDLFEVEDTDPIVLDKTLKTEPRRRPQAYQVDPEKETSKDPQEKDNDSMASRLLAAKRKNKPKS